ncbi:MAG TPA: transposase [Nitrospinaceae bacterium]|nr:transposase [Nitrospinaceae bacterium]
MDMSKSYRAAAKKHLAGIPIIFDRFHVTQLVNRAVDEVRRQHQNSLDKEGKKIIKGSRFLLLHNYENLDEDKQTRLNQILEINEPLFIMHGMKEQLRILWEKTNRKNGQRFLGTWIMDAIDVADTYLTHTGIDILKPLRRLGFSLIEHLNGILNYFDHRISNGKAEGLNNKIKTLKRQAYGFRDMEYFKLRLLHLHAQKSQLCG